MATPACNIIDIGGDKYFLGKGKPIEYAIKTREEFNIAYTDPKRGKNNPHPRIPELMCKYFPFSGIADAKQPDVNAGDINLIITTLNNRINNLAESIKITNTSLYAQRNRKILTNLRKIVSDLTHEAEKSEKKEEVRELTEATRVLEREYSNQANAFDALLQFAWFMLHPDDVPGDVKKRWAELIKELNKLNIKSIIEQIKKESKEEPGVAIEPLNYFSRLDLSGIVEKADMDSALKEAKDQAIADLRNKQRNKLAERLKSIATVLQLHGYLSVDSANKLSNTTSNSVDKFIKDVDTSLVDKIGYSFDPIFAYFKKIYDPVYTFIESTVKNFISRNMSIPIDDLISLINIGNTLLTAKLLPGKSYESTYCIVRVDNVKPEIISFLRSINVEIEKELRKETVEKEKSKLYSQLLSLPLEKPTEVATKALSRMRAQPIVGIFLAEQLVLPEEKDFSKIFTKLKSSNRVYYDKLEKENKLTSDFLPIGYKAMKDYFKQDSIYIVFGNYQNYPAAVPYVPFTIDMKDSSLTKKPVEDAITKFQKDNTMTFTLLDIISNAGFYANTPLLTMFSLIAFNQQLPTPKETIEDLHTIEEEERVISAFDEKKDFIKAEVAKLYQIANEKIDASTYTFTEKTTKKTANKTAKDTYFTQIDNAVDEDALNTILQSATNKFTPKPPAPPKPITPGAPGVPLLQHVASISQMLEYVKQKKEQANKELSILATKAITKIDNDPSIIDKVKRIDNVNTIKKEYTVNLANAKTIAEIESIIKNMYNRFKIAFQVE